MNKKKKMDRRSACLNLLMCRLGKLKGNVLYRKQLFSVNLGPDPYLIKFMSCLIFLFVTARIW